MLLEPVDYKPIGCEKPQNRAIVDGLQGPDPGIELLLRKLRLQDADALVPERRFG